MKKNNKDIGCYLWKGFVALFFILPVLYSNIVFSEMGTEIFINGGLLKTDVSPAVIDGYTYVPIRSIAEKLGFDVTYENNTKVITMCHSDSKVNITMTLNSDKAYVNDKEMVIPAPPIIIEDRTMVPVRFVSEALGSKVNWIEGYQNEGEDISYPNKVEISSPYALKLPSGNASISSAFYSNEWKLLDKEGNERSITYDVIIPQFGGMQDTTFQNELNEKFQMEYENIQNDIESNYTEQKNSKADYIYSYGDSLSFSIINDSKNILSFIEEGYYYSGGAHGMPHRIGVNIDFNKSKVLTISDLFLADKDYSKKLLDEMNAIRLSQKDEYADVEIATVLPDEHSFYLKEDKLVVFYHPYDLSYYARGFVDFEIPLKNLSEYLKDEYKAL